MNYINDKKSLSDSNKEKIIEIQIDDNDEDDDNNDEEYSYYNKKNNDKKNINIFKFIN